MQYVYSTLANDVAFKLKGGNTVTIAGQANVMDQKTLITPRSVGTSVDDGDFDELITLKTFSRMAKRGFFKAVKSMTDPEVVAKDLSAEDKAKPLTDADTSELLEVSGKKGRKKALVGL